MLPYRTAFDQLLQTPCENPFAGQAKTGKLPTLSYGGDIINQGPFESLHIPSPDCQIFLIPGMDCRSSSALSTVHARACFSVDGVVLWTFKVTSEHPTIHRVSYMQSLVLVNTYKSTARWPPKCFCFGNLASFCRLKGASTLPTLPAHI